MLITAAADRAAFTLTPGLASAEHVFLGTVVAKGDRFVATVGEPLKGSLAKGAKLELALNADDEYRAPAAPKGTVLVVATKDAMEAFGPKTFAFTWAKPTLALLGGATSLEPFGLPTTSKEKVRELLDQVFGHTELPVAVREAAMRTLLARAKPDWEVMWMGLPPALRLPSLVADFVAYFQRSPRSAFSSAARWVVFSELRSPEAATYLAQELEELRVGEDVNSARYVLDALEASGVRCVLERVRQQRGFWLGREDSNRELEVDLSARLGRMAVATCEGVAFRTDVAMPEASAKTEAQLIALRRLGLFGSGKAEALLSFAEQAKDETVVEAALLASERQLERALRPPVDTVALDRWARGAAGEYSRRENLAMRGAALALARLIRWQPSMLKWLLDHPRAMQGKYGKPDDLLDAVTGVLDYRDAAFAEQVLRELQQAGKSAGLHALAAAQPAMVQRAMKDWLAKGAGDATKLVVVLGLSSRAGLDSLPMGEVVKLAKHADAKVRAAAVDTLFSHLVGAEAYARGVPHFGVMLDALADDDATVRGAATRLINQLAVKGLYEQYRRACPELAKLAGEVQSRAKSASGVTRERYEAALKELSPEVRKSLP